MRCGWPSCAAIRSHAARFAATRRDSSPCDAICRRAVRVIIVADRFPAVRRDRPSSGAIGGRAARLALAIDDAPHTSDDERTIVCKRRDHFENAGV